MPVKFKSRYKLTYCITGHACEQARQRIAKDLASADNLGVSFMLDEAILRTLKKTKMSTYEYMGREVGLLDISEELCAPAVVVIAKDVYAEGGAKAILTVLTPEMATHNKEAGWLRPVTPAALAY